MPDFYPKPTARAWDDFAQYVPLLLGAIDAELMRRDAWDEDDRDDALYYIDDLKTFIAVLADMLMQQQTVTPATITPATTFPLLLRTARAGETIDEVLVTVDEAFDAGVLTIGDAGQVDRLLSAGENNLLAAPSQWQVSPEYIYESDTDIFVYLTGTPTIGSARVKLYSEQPQG